MENNLAVPEKDWLKGSPIGFQGPWGTTYAANLRRVLAGQTEAQWLEYAKLQRLSPMPSYVPPGGKVTTPYFVMLPRTDAQAAAKVD